MMMKHPAGPTKKLESNCYEITILGRLHERWSNSFTSLQITVQESADSPTITRLTGPVIDQPELRSILCRLWDLNLTIISVNLLRPEMS